MLVFLSYFSGTLEFFIIFFFVSNDNEGIGRITFEVVGKKLRKTKKKITKNTHYMRIMSIFFFIYLTS